MKMLRNIEYSRIHSLTRSCRLLAASIVLGLLIAIAAFGSTNSLQAASEEPLGEQGSRVIHRDESLGLSFTYPDSWQLLENPWPDLEGGDETILTSGDSGIISLTSETTLLQPEQWFAKNRHKFHAEHLRDAGRFSVGGAPAIILYQPDTCETAAMLYAIFAHENRLFKLMYLATGSEVSVAAFEAIVQSLTFYSAPESRVVLPDISTLDFNAMRLENSSCSEKLRQDLSEEAANARKCSGASMYIPTEGTLVAPWACWNAPVCPMYNPNASDPYFRSPHRGIDVAGGQGAGVTPVYATYSGVAYLYGASAIRLLFDAPFDQLAAYHAHMAGENPYVDYRTITHGQRVQAGVTLLGRQGFYGLGSASSTHLHISYHNRNTGETPWPTYDPTQFLKAEHLAFFPGWQIEGPVRCSSGDACCGCGSRTTSKVGPSGNGLFTVLGPPAPESFLSIDTTMFSDEASTGRNWPELSEPLITNSSRYGELDDGGAPPNNGREQATSGGNIPNELLPVAAAVRAEVNLGLPSSTNYQIVRSVHGMGGGLKTSTSYALLGTSGQPFATGVRTSTNYRLSSGYWGASADFAISTPTPTVAAPVTNTPTSTATATASPSATATATVIGTVPPVDTPTSTPRPTATSTAESPAATATRPANLDFSLHLPVIMRD